MNLWAWVKEVGMTGFLDITFMSLLIYIVIIGFKRTRAAFVLTGIFIVVVIYLLSRQFNLVMTTRVLEKFSAVILIIFVVIFQEEIKHFFEEIALWSLNRRLVRKRVMQLSRDEVETLVRTLMDFARERIGALIVVRGKDILVRHLEGEVNLNGELSEPLLKSIFDPHSIGHDGAVIIDGNQVTHFSCHLPLSKNLKKIKDRGTRHAAALGLSEVSDALCLVVSEEQGTICVAQNGDIQVVNDPERLTLTLERFYERIRPRRGVKPWEEFFKRNSLEKVYAVILAVGLWFVLVHDSKIIYRSFTVPITYTAPPAEWVIKELEPKEVEVTLRGPRTAFYFNVKDRLKLSVHMERREGIQQIHISTNNFVFPKGLVVDDFDPRDIRVVFDKN